jgi:hypothetical protein
VRAADQPSSGPKRGARACRWPVREGASARLRFCEQAPRPWPKYNEDNPYSSLSQTSSLIPLAFSQFPHARPWGRTHSGAVGTGTGRPRRSTRARTGLDSGPTFNYGPSSYAGRRYESGGARGSGGHGEWPPATVTRLSGHPRPLHRSLAGTRAYSAYREVGCRDGWREEGPKRVGRVRTASSIVSRAGTAKSARVVRGVTIRGRGAGWQGDWGESRGAANLA